MRLLLAAAAVTAALQAGPLDLADLIRRALEANPEVLAAQKNYEAALQRPSQESALPDTMLSLGYAASGAPYPGAGLGRDPTSNAGIMITQEFPFPGKRKLRAGVARAEADAERDNYRAAQLGVVSRLKQAYYRLGHSYLMAEVLDSNRGMLVSLLKAAEIRYSAGKSAQQDVFKVQTRLSLVETRLIQLERERIARESEILSLVNLPPTERLGRAVVPVPQPLNRTLEEMLAAANRNAPQLDRGRHLIQRSQLALNLARKDYYPDYAVSGGYFNMGGMPDMYQFRVDLKLPTSLFRKQKAAETEQSNRLASAQRTLETTAQFLAFRIKEDFTMAETSLRLLKTFEHAVVPQATLALESSLASYQTGQVDLLSVLSNLLEIFEYQMNYHEEMLNAHLAVARLEEMTGIRMQQGDLP